ncbi:LOW QUALITY PROTEIN: P2X purinoceptor 5-like [Liasis olivaceus]
MRGLHLPEFPSQHGVAFTNTLEMGKRIWDVVDYVIPQGESVVFVMTNLIITPNQRQDTCAKNPGIPDALCYRDQDCTPGEPVTSGNGIIAIITVVTLYGTNKAGLCIKIGNNISGTCEILAWCPVEKKDRPESALLANAENFTVYIKNTIRFPRFNFSKTNVLDTKDDASLKMCRYGAEQPDCPTFSLGKLVSWAGSHFQEMASELQKFSEKPYGAGHLGRLLSR